MIVGPEAAALGIEDPGVAIGPGCTVAGTTVTCRTADGSPFTVASIDVGGGTNRAVAAGSVGALPLIMLGGQGPDVLQGGPGPDRISGDDVIGGGEGTT